MGYFKRRKLICLKDSFIFASDCMDLFNILFLITVGKNDDIKVYVDKFKQAAESIHSQSSYYFQTDEINPYITGK